jgi:hypothetical protein
MWAHLVPVDDLDGDALRAQRERLRLSKEETSRRMFAWICDGGPGTEGAISLVAGDFFAWATESACRRAIDDLEGNRRVLKEHQYVESLLGVLGIERPMRPSTPSAPRH